MKSYIIFKRVVKLFVTAVFCFLINSCEKENAASNKEEPIVYQCFINDHESSLRRVNISTNTYFPEENITTIQGYGKSKDRNLFDEKYLKDYDSLGFIPDYMGYAGCIVYMEIKLRFKEDLNLETEVYALSDTIDNNFTYSFTWPEDTINSKAISQ